MSISFTSRYQPRLERHFWGGMCRQWRSDFNAGRFVTYNIRHRSAAYRTTDAHAPQPEQHCGFGLAELLEPGVYRALGGMAERRAA